MKIVSFPLGSRIASIAATRPLMAAEPMLRAPRPEMVDELNGAGVGSAAKTAPAKQAARTREYLEKRMDLFGSGGGKFENCVVDRRVRFGLVDDHFLFIGRTFRPALEREREKDAVDFFVVTDVG